MSRRIAIGNNKGGSGKTAVTINLAAALSELGKTVLVVDLDPQANATRRLAVDTKAGPSVSEALLASTPGVHGAAADAVRECGWNGGYSRMISVIPARFDLENRISEAATVGAIGRLRRALTGIDDEYDVTLFDCPPSLGHLTQNAMACAEACIAAIEPEFDSVDGGLRYKEFIEVNRLDLTNPDLYLLGAIMTRVRTGVGAHTFQLGGVDDMLGKGMVWKPYVPERAVIKDAADASLPLMELRTTKARDMSSLFRDLATGMLDQLGTRRVVA